MDQKAEEALSLGLRARFLRAWARDGHLSLMRRLQKGTRYIAQLIRARFALRNCDRVGSSARVAGSTRVENRGSIVIGDYLNINSAWIPTELITGQEGQIQIGDDVLINFGTVIAAGKSVSIGSGSMIGPYCIVSDVDIPDAITLDAVVGAKPIEIGKHVWLAARVTVRPGVRIGDGAVIVAGSIVESDVPANAIATGIPARSLPRMSPMPEPPAEQRAAAESPAAAVPYSNPPKLQGGLMADFPHRAQEKP